MTGVLEVTEGPQAGRVAELGTGIVIGRDTGGGLDLDDPQVSRRHAEISSRPGGFVVEDLGSSNGTFLNDAELHGPTRLYPGDQLILGTTVVRFLAQRPGPEASGVLPVPPALAAPEARPDFIERVVDHSLPSPAGNRALESLVDRRVRAQARLAPLALVALVVLIVVVFEATK